MPEFDLMIGEWDRWVLDLATIETTQECKEDFESDLMRNKRSEFLATGGHLRDFLAWLETQPGWKVTWGMCGR